MRLDCEEAVAVHAIQLSAHLLALDMLEPEECVEMCELVFFESRAISHAAGEFTVRYLFSEDFMAKAQQSRVPKGGRGREGGEGEGKEGGKEGGKGREGGGGVTSELCMEIWRFCSLLPREWSKCSETSLYRSPWGQHFLATISRWLLQTGRFVQEQCNWD